tara:strand:+ start:2679 stop:3773 length:1095 start_codon:yes stop_codon:yes gene_type:complete
MLPQHGKIECSTCYGPAEKEAFPHELWKMRNDPGAWGGAKPEWLVLGFSKGSTQADYYDNGSFEEVAFAGMRPRLERILKHLGALSAGESLDAAIANPAGNVAFGSLIRCSVARQDESGKYQCSGPLIKKSFKEIPQVISACTNRFLKELPDSVRTVVMLGNDSGYIKHCHSLIKDLFPVAFEEVNDVAARADGRLWLHVAHPSGANGHFEGWMESQSEASRKRKLVEEALGLFGADTAIAQSGPDPEPETSSPQMAAPPVSVDDVPTFDSSGVAPLPEKSDENWRLYSRVKRGKKAGALLVPHLYKDGCYVVSMTRFEEDQIRVGTIEEVISYIRKGYKLRMSDPDHPIGPSLISPSSIEFNE